MSIFLLILEYVIELYIIFLLAIPMLLLASNTKWYIEYKKRKEAERWERISKFFAENADEYPEAAVSFGMARFWASQQGYNTMYKIKKAEYYALNLPKSRENK